MAWAEFTILFRETFEIALLLSLVLATIRTSGKNIMARAVWIGAAGGLIASALAGVLLAGVAEEIESTLAAAEGVLLLVSALLVSGIILWMARQAGNSKEIRSRVEAGMRQGENALMFLSFVIVLREGMEIALFLIGLFMANGGLELAGVLGGIAAALALSWALSHALMRLDICRFFTLSGILLILIAGGLVSSAVHELQESKVLADGEPIYNLNPPVNADGTYPLLHEKGAIGGMLKSMVGYSAKPTALQLFAQLAYIALMTTLWIRESRTTEICNVKTAR